MPFKPSGDVLDTLAVNGGSLTSTAAAFNLLNAAVTTLNIGGAATTIALGAASTVLTLGSNATINGGAAANDDLTLQGTSHATRTSSYVILQPNGGNVGIGTTGPTAKLDVNSSNLPSLYQLSLTNSDTSGLAVSPVLAIFKLGNSGGTRVNGSITGRLGSGAEQWIRYDSDNNLELVTTRNVGSINLYGTQTTHIGIGDSNVFGSPASSYISFGYPVSPNTSSGVAFIIQGNSGQTGDLQQWKNSSGTILAEINSSGNVGIGTTGPTTLLQLANTTTITGAVTDGYSAALTLTPGYTAATAQTVTRHNYIDVNNVTVAGAGPAAVTDAAVLRFDAAAGTHKATVGATTKTTPGGVNGWIKMNVAGTLMYVPMYLSTTA